MDRAVTICTYIAPNLGVSAAAVYRPEWQWQARFAPRFAIDKECALFNQTPVERLSECIKTHYPDAEISVIENRAPWE